MTRAQSSRSDSTSLTVLRDQGPMTLRELTRATAKRMGWSLMYEDVDGLMRMHERQDQATRTRVGNDYRDDVWSAT